MSNKGTNTAKLNQDYIVYKDKLIGKGAFSRVYLGRQIKTKKPVAVKVIKLTNLDEKTSKIVEAEINIMLMIKKDPHPNIVECYDTVRHPENKYMFIIMEYCDSGDLRTILKKPIQERYTQFYFTQLANGLKYLDSRNIVHRDIKPRNILLTNQRRILKIADFGFAKHRQNIENDSKLKPINLYDTMCGSPLYMAPEVMVGGYNKQIDLWSVGMILYEMLYAKHPYGSCTNLTELKNKIADTDIQIPYVDNKGNKINAEVSQECLSLLKMLLQKDVNKRISWDNFFNHKWLDPYKYTPKTKSNLTSNPVLVPTSKKIGINPEPDFELEVKPDSSPNNRYKDKICSTSLGSLTYKRTGPEMVINIIDIIDDYYDSMYFSNQTKNLEVPEVSMDENDSYVDDKGMVFHMESNTDSIIMKPVVDESSLLSKTDKYSHRYEVIDIKQKHE